MWFRGLQNEAGLRLGAKRTTSKVRKNFTGRVGHLLYIAKPNIIKIDFHHKLILLLYPENYAAPRT